MCKTFDLGIFMHMLIKPKREKKFRQIFEKMEGFSFITPVTGLNRPNTGKEDDVDDKASYFFRNW
jgi:hypothetical protein